MCSSDLFPSHDNLDQMAAQFGIKAPEYMGNHAHYIGGWSNVISINEVLNTNLEADGSQAVIAGKVGLNSGGIWSIKQKIQAFSQ